MNDFSVGRVVAAGVAYGVVFGLPAWLVSGELWIGLVSGSLFGLFMAVALRRQLGSTALRGLSRAERRKVVRTVRRGESVEDPRLAEPAVRHADAVLAAPFKPKSGRVLFAIALGLGLVGVVLGVIADGWGGLLTGGPLVAVSLVMLVVVIPYNERVRTRVERSAHLNRPSIQD